MEEVVQRNLFKETPTTGGVFSQQKEFELSGWGEPLTILDSFKKGFQLMKSEVA
jgi:hypothetical protein